MKIGILTITPNIGFGGIMQAFALKTVLEDISDSKVSVISYKPTFSFKNKLIYFARGIYRNIFLRQYSKLTYKSDYEYRSVNIAPFLKKYINLTKEISTPSKLHDYINKNFDILVVGSDQVWRPKYVLGINNYFAEGINDKIKKIAYAVSFGVEEWEYDKEQTVQCQELLQRFEYISVREQSGIRLIENHFKFIKNIYCDLDPTLLLSPDFYQKFLLDKPLVRNYLFTYVLDNNTEKEQIVQKIETCFGKVLYSFNTSAENPSKPLKERIAPKVEDWLSGIYYSDYVITDSFHGCVFSIIFNKPFFVYVNKNRGADRFVSILAFLGLSERMIFDPSEYNEEILKKEIDWFSVNNLLNIKRKQIYKRLKGIINNR